jgi:hypothetical protein
VRRTSTISKASEASMIDNLNVGSQGSARAVSSRSKSDEHSA